MNSVTESLSVALRAPFGRLSRKLLVLVFATVQLPNAHAAQVLECVPEKGEGWACDQLPNDSNSEMMGLTRALRMVCLIRQYDIASLTASATQYTATWQGDSELPSEFHLLVSRQTGEFFLKYNYQASWWYHRRYNLPPTDANVQSMGHCELRDVQTKF